jgi:Tfp pilus assembly protein PilX
MKGKRQASILFISILILTVMGVLGTTILFLAEKERRIIDSTQSQYDTLYAAEDCIEQGMRWLEKQNVMGKLPIALLGTEDYVTVHEGNLEFDTTTGNQKNIKVSCSYVIKERGVGSVVQGNDIGEAYGYTNPDLGKQFYYEVQSTGTSTGSAKKVVEVNAIYGL